MLNIETTKKTFSIPPFHLAHVNLEEENADILSLTYHKERISQSGNNKSNVVLSSTQTPLLSIGVNTIEQGNKTKIEFEDSQDIDLNFGQNDFALVVNSSSDSCFYLPIRSWTFNNLDIDWGDGITQTYTETKDIFSNEGLYHSYPAKNTLYTITLKGTCYRRPITEELTQKLNTSISYSHINGECGFGFVNQIIKSPSAKSNSLTTYDATFETRTHSRANRVKIIELRGSLLSLLPDNFSCRIFYEEAFSISTSLKKNLKKSFLGI
jgi:hypothetical protein